MYRKTNSLLKVKNFAFVCQIRGRESKVRLSFYDKDSSDRFFITVLLYTLLVWSAPENKESLGDDYRDKFLFLGFLFLFRKLL